MIGVIGTAADLIECPTLGDLDLMGVKVVLCLDVTEDEGITEDVDVAFGVNFVK